MPKTKIEEKGDGIFIPRELLDELEIEEAQRNGQDTINYKRVGGIYTTRGYESGSS